jgi:hypothetical protein
MQRTRGFSVGPASAASCRWLGIMACISTPCGAKATDFRVYLGFMQRAAGWSIGAVHPAFGDDEDIMEYPNA